MQVGRRLNPPPSLMVSSVDLFLCKWCIKHAQTIKIIITVSVPDIQGLMLKTCTFIHLLSLWNFISHLPAVLPANSPKKKISHTCLLCFLSPLTCMSWDASSSPLFSYHKESFTSLHSWAVPVFVLLQLILQCCSAPAQVFWTLKIHKNLPVASFPDTTASRCRISIR